MQDQGKNLIFQHQNKSFTILSSKFALAIGIYDHQPVIINRSDSSMKGLCRNVLMYIAAMYVWDNKHPIEACHRRQKNDEATRFDADRLREI